MLADAQWIKLEPLIEARPTKVVTLYEIAVNLCVTRSTITGC